MLNLLKLLISKYCQLIVYCIIGCTGATLDFAVYALLTACRIGMHYQLANFLSVSVGIINNFFWNCYFNFKMKDRILKRLTSFYSIGMLGWALSAGSLWLFIEIMGVNAIVSKLGTIFIVTVVQFCLNKFITFRR